MQINEAFLEYESVRHRLPAVSEIGQCTYLSNLEDLIDKIDIFLFYTNHKDHKAEISNVHKFFVFSVAL